MQFRSSLRQSVYSATVAAEPTPVLPDVPDARTRKIAKARAAKTLTGRLRDALIAFHEYKSAHVYLGRYSVDKLVRFDHYCHATSPWRVAFVIAATPVPVVTIVLFFQAVPLDDPARGAAHNWRVFPWSIGAHTLLSLATLSPLKQALRFSDAMYPMRTLVAIAGFAAVTNELLWAVPAFLWRFPVPLRELSAGATWPVLLALGHVLFARRVVQTKWGRVKKYLPIVGAQFTLFFAFLGLALVFGRLSRPLQFAWVVCFPWFKLAMKKWLWQYSRRLDDISTDVTVCLVEIASALYQSVCMQLMESVAAAMLLMIMDFAQAGIEVYMYTRVGFLVDGATTIATAVKIVESSLFPGCPDERERADSTASTRPTPAARVPRRRTWHGAAQTNDRASVAMSPRNSTVAESTATTTTPYYRTRSTATTTTTTTTSSSSGAPRRRSNRRWSCPTMYVTKNPNSVFMAPADYEQRTISRRRLLNLRRHSVVRARELVAVSRTASASSSSGDLSVQFTGVHALARLETNVQIDHLLVKRKDQARILEQALQLLFSCEVLIFVEYVEVMMPLLYTTIATVAWFLPNAKYNLMLCMLSRDKLFSGLGYTVGYAMLEMGTFVAMCLFMQRTFGVNTLYQLAFVLESYAMTIQGKLIGSFIVIVNLAIVHQGVDVTVLTGAATDTPQCGFSP